MAKATTSVTSVRNPMIDAAVQRQAQLTAELNALSAFIATVGGEVETETATPRRRRKAGRPQSSGKRGRPKGSKNKPTADKPASDKPKAEAKGRRGRPAGSRSRNGMSLIRAVATVLAEASEAMKVADIATAVNKLGYKSDASSFKTMISQTLGKLSEAKVAKTTSRGVWESANGISKFLEELNADEAEATAAATNDNIPI